MKYYVTVSRNEPYEGSWEIFSEEFKTLEDAIAVAKVEHLDREDEYDIVRIEVEGWKELE